MKKFFLIFFFIIIFGCSFEEREKAEAVGRLTYYLYKIETGEYYSKITEKYPDLQIGLIYYDPIDDTYKAVDPRRGFEKLGYSGTFNREIYYYVMYKLTEDALKDEHRYVEKELLKALKTFEEYLREAKETEKKDRELIQMVITYGPIGIIIFSLLVGSGIAYLLFSIARKHLS
ncbi:hypothetical protein GWK41_02245 [Persephonella atlantica]|uniref:Lipoprotein n=1 Tax=Persephonella atlantica TaxID=2699429 RepID=A0ABS1GGK5_9AQUI|nr:hypothetical protein [Persephonella atlantica]MBK3331887.1 hypothetical protein [Persephonella atlantica]